MVKNGMHFASPAKGNRHVYEKIYLAMRNLYMRCDPWCSADVSVSEVVSPLTTDGVFLVGSNHARGNPDSDRSRTRHKPGF